ncbi:MmgE/PrpD family protein [Alterisphingorhabdus coralli]|uniref:MmgE/PrpD family protein n=1 Tax=Alterisphingorhabdus coralli TaxID=3071408 RepID=A0AA97F8S8_9SPHN|nr:MmgE/PrpD family protein [Parasphingorhabdus sp. SCSIO 66989]WOE75382.1 MmgE/PrpD family protein [Parasphingorhabdus sp. SCSIO 66989]
MTKTVADHSAGYTAAICNFAATGHVLPDAAKAHAERLLADTLAGGAAGAASPEAQHMLAAVKGWGHSEDSRLLSLDGRLPAPSAAFFNGFAIHCLEWDAVHEPAVVHALSVVTAALLAASDRKGGSDSEAFLTALAIGVDIASGIGLSATGPMRFFRPASAGIIGAALAVARLEAIAPVHYPDVMGLAYSFCSGTMQAHVEASVALPLQIGNAARAAITAVDLVKADMDGPHNALQGPFGYSALIEEIDLADYVASLGKVWRIAEVSIKPYPSGRASHGALGALAGIQEEHGLKPDDIDSIALYAPPLIHRLVGRSYKADMSPAYARLCFAILAPMMLRDGHIDPRHFDAAGLNDQALVPLANNTQVVLDDNPDGNALAPQRLVLSCRNGKTIERTIDANLGSPEAPMNSAQYNQKYSLCRDLADTLCDPRIFDHPLVYATEPK